MGIGKWFDMSIMNREEVMRGFDVLLQYGKLASGMTKEKYLYYRDETPIIFVDQNDGVIYRTSSKDNMVCSFLGVNDITLEVIKESYNNLNLTGPTPKMQKEDVYTKDQFFEDIREALNKIAKQGFKVEGIKPEFIETSSISERGEFKLIGISYDIDVSNW